MNFKITIFNQIKCGKLADKTMREILSYSPFLHTKEAKRQAKTALLQLEAEGKVIKDKNGRYSVLRDTATFTGIVRANARGFAFITPDGNEKFKNDFFLPPRSADGVYDGDRVLAAKVKGTKDEAQIIKILERGRKNITGVLEVLNGVAYLYPDDEKMPEVCIPLSLTLNANTGDKVLCEITSYPKNGNLKGKVIEILGSDGTLSVEELAIIRSYGLYKSFPESVEKEAEKVCSAKICADGVKDLRDKLIFTIDGEDTRDIDDGVSLEIVEGNFLLGVHIADVSRYVKLGSELDKEAYKRGTSVYFPDDVYPMLPKLLSNGACSLNENEDRYALSCFMLFDKNGTRLNYEICESVIRSRHKTTYPEITAICNGEIPEKYKDIAESVLNMQKLCIILENLKKDAGYVDLDVKEAKIYLDGEKIIIPDFKRTISERIIEQFMISANEAVAEFMQKNKIPCLYRIHELPAPEKIATLNGFIKDLGVNYFIDGDTVTPKDFQNVLSLTENKPYASVVNKVMLRCMQKARYSNKNPGHFGLASSCYCHFTSPIRRYPDLFVHRALKDFWRGGKNLKTFKEQVKSAGDDCSERERAADDVERAVDDLYKLYYMNDKIGETFDAVVSGVTNFGVFCELENTIEGLIPLEVLPADNYEYFAEKFLLKGRKNSFKLGDKIKIFVDGCDFGKMRPLFSVAK